jgi:hypothetical protein
MRTLLCTALAFMAACQSAATQAPSKPNTLTPQEVAEGWILLFDGETTFGWQADGEFKATDGELVLGGEKECTLTTMAVFGDCDVSFQYRQVGKKRDAELRFKGVVHRAARRLEQRAVD